MKKSAPILLKSGRLIGQGQPCFIVAEIGNNHQGDFSVACKMVEMAADAGANAVKFQKRDIDAMFTQAGREMPYGGRNSFGPTYGEHRLALELGIEELARLKDLAEELGMTFFASAWDCVSLTELCGIGMELIKICSADLVNIPLLRQAGSTGLPLIISTGMSDYSEIDLAVAELRRFHDRIIMLHCNSSYPCPEEQIALPVMSELRRRYQMPIGYSGHEAGIGPSVASVSLQACVVERHFTLDKNMRGTDHQASLEPEEFKLMSRMIREVEQAMGQCGKEVFETERNMAKKLRKSIVFHRDLPAGHVLSEKDLTVKCPGDGISPIHWREFIGARLLVDARQDDQLTWEMVSLSNLGQLRERPAMTSQGCGRIAS